MGGKYGILIVSGCIGMGPGKFVDSSGTHEFWVDISSVPNALSGCTIINDLCLNSTHSNSLKNL